MQGQSCCLLQCDMEYSIKSGIYPLGSLAFGYFRQTGLYLFIGSNPGVDRVRLMLAASCPMEWLAAVKFEI